VRRVHTQIDVTVCTQIGTAASDLSPCALRLGLVFMYDVSPSVSCHCLIRRDGVGRHWPEDMVMSVSLRLTLDGHHSVYHDHLFCSQNPQMEQWKFDLYDRTTYTTL